MTHHDDHQQQSSDDGLVLEQWILRGLLIGVLGAIAAAVLASLDDIKRYVRIKSM